MGSTVSRNSSSSAIGTQIYNEQSAQTDSPAQVFRAEAGQSKIQTTQWADAWRLLARAKQCGEETGLPGLYREAIDTCANTGQWETALALLEELWKRDIEPGEDAYSAVVDACSSAGEHELALALLEAVLESAVSLSERQEP